MQILALNAGSSSLKFKLCGPKQVLASGKLPPAAKVIDLLRDLAKSGIDAIGNRVVHGGPRLSRHVQIDDEVVREIQAADDLAPLHNKAALEIIQLARSEFPTTPSVAVFDTVFFSDLPQVASTYAIPRGLADKYSIRRYGFHGLAHQAMCQRYAAASGASTRRLITLQLGSGCSAAAVRDGKPIDTSMGFTPLEGLAMSTRCGDVDPAITAFLVDREHLPAGKVCELLYHESGLLGISGISGDTRELERRRASDPRAALALDVFCYRIRKYIGAYLAVLGGADAIVFGGGIGQNSASIRSEICRGLEWCGVRVDEQRNLRARGREGRISSDESQIAVWVVEVDEERIIAEETYKVVSKGAPRTMMAK